MAEETSEIPEV